MTTAAEPKKDIFKITDADGQFRRQTSQFRSSVSADPNSQFPAEANRYVVYINYGCPWAHRVNLVLHLKGLTSIIRLVVLDTELGPDGWFFSGRFGTDEIDPIYGFKFIKELYHKADPNYALRYTVPVLWDKKKETIVNNESSEIIRFLYTAFDAFVPQDRTEAARPLFPENLRAEIETMNDWVYNTVNNGVYKTGFATTQAAYDEHLAVLFKSLDRLEKHLEDRGAEGGPFLFGQHITEADIRLFTTLIRFDVAYVTLFRCNLQMIRFGYPKLDKWLRTLYWDDGVESNGGAFKKTTDFEQVSHS
jgi:putative glutathione S-transferase